MYKIKGQDGRAVQTREKIQKLEEKSRDIYEKISKSGQKIWKKREKEEIEKWNYIAELYDLD